MRQQFRVLLVDAKGSGEFRLISDAVREAAAGDTIELAAGQFEERVLVNKGVEITAQAGTNLGDVVVTSGFIIAAPQVTLRNIVVRHIVDVRSGSLTMTKCDVSLGPDGVRVCTGASATLRECNIHNINVNGDGILVQEDGKAVVEQCTISDCRVNGIHAKQADVTVSKCAITNCDFGIYFRKKAKGTVEDNTMSKIKSFAIYVVSESEPLVQRNTVSECGVHGLLVSQRGGGTYKDNSFMANVKIAKGCAPTLLVNTVNGRTDNEAS